MIEKLSQIKHEKTLAEQELKERAQESQELKEKLTEISTKLEILEDKKFRLSQQVDESLDLKENLLAHLPKKIIKLNNLENIYCGHASTSRLGRIIRLKSH